MQEQGKRSRVQPEQLGLKEENYINGDGRDIKLSHYDIAFEHVNSGYESGRQILKDVTFRIPERTTAAIVGPSGSGKSTICNLLARFYDVSGGIHLSAPCPSVPFLSKRIFAIL